jgi:hypothetical protein
MTSANKQLNMHKSLFVDPNIESQSRKVVAAIYSTQPDSVKSKGKKISKDFGMANSSLSDLGKIKQQIATLG